ncbi:MAG TPA: DUF4386 domain-containing protein [Pyrinomonadaceae bacterium]|nr:DUF4386 domain-containing protein [Pyrinomonadaceae bacterium]
MDKTSPRAVGRWIAVLFLMVLVCGVIAQGFISDGLIDFKDAAGTAGNVLGNRGLFQSGFTIYMIEMICQIATAALWYVLLRPVSKPIALVAAFVELGGSVVKIAARVLYLAPLWVLDHGQTLGGFSTEQLQSLSLVLWRVNDVGAATAVAMFGVSTFLNGYLIFKSKFMPWWLGVMSMVAGLGWLTFFYPTFGRSVFMPLAVYALASSVVMIAWLLFVGVKDEAVSSEA